MTTEDARRQARMICRKQIDALRYAGVIRPDADTSTAADVGTLAIAAALIQAFEEGKRAAEKPE